MFKTEGTQPCSVIDTWVASDVYTYMHTQASDKIAVILITQSIVLLTNIMHIHTQMVTNSDTNKSVRVSYPERYNHNAKQTYESTHSDMKTDSVTGTHVHHT